MPSAGLQSCWSQEGKVQLANCVNIMKHRTIIIIDMGFQLTTTQDGMVIGAMDRNLFSQVAVGFLEFVV